jgi:hypothetical protein
MLHFRKLEMKERAHKGAQYPESDSELRSFGANQGAWPTQPALGRSHVSSHDDGSLP